MTILEFNTKLLGRQKYLDERNREYLLGTYYSGLFSQADLSKYSIDKWYQELQPQEIKDKIKNDELEEGKALFEAMKKFKKKGN